jgi:hypothetical protein
VAVPIEAREVWPGAFQSARPETSWSTPRSQPFPQTRGTLGCAIGDAADYIAAAIASFGLFTFCAAKQKSVSRIRQLMTTHGFGVAALGLRIALGEPAIGSRSAC